MIIDGKALAAKIRGEVKEKVARLKERGVQPGLAVILAGEDPASKVYVRNKIKACEETGVRSFFIEVPASAREVVIDYTAPAAPLGGTQLELVAIHFATPQNARSVLLGSAAVRVTEPQ